MENQGLKIHALKKEEFLEVLKIINEAAKAYGTVLPPHVYKEPQMTFEEFLEEAKRIKFYVAKVGSEIVGVMGYEYVDDVALIRHAYIKPNYQRRGIGTLLLKHLENLIKLENKVQKLIVGTYSLAYWALAFYQKHGYKILEASGNILRKYYRIPDIQRENSVALEKTL